MTKRERFNYIYPILYEKFGIPKCALDYENVYQLMVAVVLSAQCTDVRVNIVTKELFKIVKKPEDINNMKIEKLESLIQSTGFYRNKAKNLKLNAKRLLEEFNGNVPNKMEDLITLAGVGRKTANVVLGDYWGISVGIVVDTHVKRLSNRIGFITNDENPESIEVKLMKIIPKKYWFVYSNYLILHGRDKCKARKPQCEACEIKSYCKYYETSQK